MTVADAMETHAAELEEGLAALGIQIAPERLTRLVAFGGLLLKWNRVYNLTAIREPREIITHHLLDSLAVLPWIRTLGTLADIGSGAGFPGIPLALACPDLAVYSVETVGKKASFQQQAKIELRLENLTVIHRRAESVSAADFPGGGADGVISRAFSSLAEFVRLAGPWIRDGGALYAMKGSLPQAETAALPAGWQVQATHPLTIPKLEAERHLLVIRRG